MGCAVMFQPKFSALKPFLWSILSVNYSLCEVDMIIFYMSIILQCASAMHLIYHLDILQNSRAPGSHYE